MHSGNHVVCFVCDMVVSAGTVGSSEDLSRDAGAGEASGGAQTPTTPRRASASSAIPVLKRYQGIPSPLPHAWILSHDKQAKTIPVKVLVDART